MANETALALALVALVGCHKLACGDGTYDSGHACLPDIGSCDSGTFPYEGACVAYDPNDTTAPTTTASPAGGAFRTLPTVVLTPNEPATVRYTTDGSDPSTATGVNGQVVVSGLQDGVPLKFFSTDAAGNAEAVQSVTYTVDTTGPAAVTGASATVSTGISLSWTNPGDSDLAGVLVTRFTGWLEGSPSGGTAYTAGDSFGDQQVLGTETGTTATDDPGPGVWRYALYPVDDLDNYGPPVVVDADVPLPAQTAVISLDYDAGNSSVTTAPTVLGMTTALNVSRSAWTVTVENTTGRTLFSPKLLITADPDAVVTGTPDGTLDTTPYFRPGVGGIAPGSRAAWRLTVPSTGTGTHTISVTFEADPAIVAAVWPSSTQPLGWLVDTATHGPYASFQQSADFLAVRGTAEARGGVLSPDGRFLYSGSRMTPVLQVHDLSTGQIVLETEVSHTAAKAATTDLAADMDRQVLYATLMDGRHSGFLRKGQSNDETAQKAMYLLRYDPVTMVETGRVELVAPALTNGYFWSPRHIALSPDGTLAAIPLIEVGSSPYNSAIALVDLSTMTQIDTDSSTDGVQSLVGGDGMMPSNVTFSSDGSKLFVNDIYDSTGGLLGVFDTSTWAWSSVSVDPGQGRIIQLSVDDSGLLWIGGKWNDHSGAYTYDGSTVTNIGGSEPGYRAFGASPDGSVIYAADVDNYEYIEAFDASTKASLWVSDPIAESVYSHHLLVTP